MKQIAAPKTVTYIIRNLVEECFLHKTIEFLNIFIRPVLIWLSFLQSREENMVAFVVRLW